MNESARERTDVLLEWLCLHLEEEDLPKGFDPRGRNLDVIRPGQNFAAPTPAAHVDGNNDTGLSFRGIGEGEGKGGVSVEGRLLQYGFGRAEVMRAIAEALEGSGVDKGGQRGDSLDARMLGPLEILSRGLVSSGPSSVVSGDKRRGGRGGGDAEDGFQTEKEGREKVEEEVMSLEAIYDEAVTVAPRMPLVGRCAEKEVALKVCSLLCVPYDDDRWKPLYIQDKTIVVHCTSPRVVLF